MLSAQLERPGVIGSYAKITTKDIDKLKIAFGSIDKDFVRTYGFPTLGASFNMFSTLTQCGTPDVPVLYITEKGSENELAQVKKVVDSLLSFQTINRLRLDDTVLDAVERLKFESGW